MKGEQGTPSPPGREGRTGLTCQRSTYSDLSTAVRGAALKDWSRVSGSPGGQRSGCAGKSQGRALAAAPSPHPWVLKPAGQGQQPPVAAPWLLCRARPRAALCVCLANICSEHLCVLFLLSPLRPPLSVCQNTNGPLLGPCHLVSIRVTLVTAFLLDLCA